MNQVSGHFFIDTRERNILCIYMYKRYEEIPLSFKILESKCGFLGLILRRNSTIPANVAMKYCFLDNINIKRGRAPTSLPVILNSDLKRLQNEDFRLKTKLDHQLFTRAQTGQKWSDFTAEMERITQAARSDHIASRRH